MDMSLWGTCFNPCRVTRADSTQACRNVTECPGGNPALDKSCGLPRSQCPHLEIRDYSHFLIELS